MPRIVPRPFTRGCPSVAIADSNLQEPVRQVARLTPATAVRGIAREYPSAFVDASSAMEFVQQCFTRFSMGRDIVDGYTIYY